MRGKPLSSEEYLASEVICSPLRKYDCCLESDGAAAVIVAAEGVAGHRRVRVLGVREGHPGSPDDIINGPDMIQIGLAKAAAAVYEKAGRGPDDMDFAEIYDCFTYIVMRQLEELGFCPRGESPRFVHERGIGVDGRLPINTHGGL